jgi:hypothetical protein
MEITFLKFLAITGLAISVFAISMNIALGKAIGKMSEEEQ